MPRELAPPRSKMRQLRAADLIAHWPLNEAGGTPVVDSGPHETDLVSSSSANVVSGPFYGDTSNRGRTTTAAHATGAAVAAQRTAVMSGSWTAEVWCKPAALAGHLLVQGSAGALGLVVRLVAAGGVVAEWTNGGTVAVTTPTGLVAVDTLAHIAVRCRVVAGTRTVEVFVNGALAVSSTGLGIPTGGATGSWVLGADSAFANRFNGDLYDVRFAAVALPDDGIRDSWARGVRDYDHAVLYASGFYEVYGRALLHNGGSSWIDLSNHFGVDWVDAMEWEEAVDDQGASGTLTLRREVFDLSMVPTRSTSPINSTTPLFELLRVTALVRLEVAVVPMGTGRDGLTEADWLPAFRGVVVGLDTAVDPVKVELFDLSASLQDVWVEPDRAFSPPRDRTYGTTIGTAVEAQLQQIVTDNVPPTVGYIGGTPEIWTPTVSGVNVRTWVTTPSKNVLTALEDVVTQFGFDIRYGFDDTRQEWRLTFAEPPRTRVWVSGDPVLDAGTVLERPRLALNRDDIRNVVEVEYGDEDPDHPGTIKRETVVVTNAASVSRFGRRYCRIGLASDSQVNDLTRATALANMVLSDLSWPLADAEVLIPFRHHLQLHDVVKCLADEIHFDADTTLATVGLRQRVAGGAARTTLKQRGTVSGKRWKWFEILTLALGAASTTPPATPTGVSVGAIVNGARIVWTLPAFRASRRLRETEIHWSTTAGFTPSAATLKERVRGASSISLGNVTPGAAHYFKIGHVDDMGNVSAWSPQVAVVPRQLPVTGHVRTRLSSNVTIAVSTFVTIGFNTDDTDVLSRHAAGSYTALSAGLLAVDARALLDAAAKPSAPSRIAVYVNGVVRVTGATVLTNSGAAPNRAQCDLTTTIAVAANDVVTVRAYCEGNAGTAVIADATFSRAWFTPLTQD